MSGDDSRDRNPMQPDVYDTFSAPCRGPVDGECENVVVLNLPFYMTENETVYRCRCSVCGTTNAVHKHTTQADAEAVQDL